MKHITKKILEALIVREMGKEDLYRKALMQFFNDADVSEKAVFLSVIGVKPVKGDFQLTVAKVEKAMDEAGIEDVKQWCSELGIDPLSEEMNEMKCWKGYRKVGTKKNRNGKTVNNCVKIK